MKVVEAVETILLSDLIDKLESFKLKHGNLQVGIISYPPENLDDQEFNVGVQVENPVLEVISHPKIKNTQLLTIQ